MKILQKLLTVILLISLVPLIVIGMISLNNMAHVGSVTTEVSDQLADTITEQSKTELSRSAYILADKVAIYTNSYKNDLSSLSKHPGIFPVLLEADQTGKINDNLKTETDKAKLVANHYPASKEGNWQDVYDYFNAISKERQSELDGIRIFHKDGYVVVGVLEGKEAVNDFKGDKLWFKQTMDETYAQPGDYLDSPISIARATGKSAIRYSTPVEDAQGNRLGLMIMNFKANAVTKTITDFKFGKSGYAMFLDKAYENAEGVITRDWVVTIAKPTADGSSFEIKEQKEFASIISKNQLVGNEGFVEYMEGEKQWVAAYYKVPNDKREWYVVVTAPYEEIQAAAVTAGEKIQETVSATQVVVISVLLITFVIALIVGIILSNRISKPLVQLKDAADQITSGKFDTELPQVKGNDEVAELTGSMAILIMGYKIKSQEKKK
jgi:HAMP domain-containing protein